MLYITLTAKGLVVELTYSHVQSAWRFKGERVRVAGLAACYNYFSLSIYIYSLNLMLYRRSLNFELDIFYFKDPVFLKVCERGGGGRPG